MSVSVTIHLYLFQRSGEIQNKNKKQKFLSSVIWSDVASVVNLKRHCILKQSATESWFNKADTTVTRDTSETVSRSLSRLFEIWSHDRPNLVFPFYCETKHREDKNTLDKQIQWTHSEHWVQVMLPCVRMFCWCDSVYHCVCERVRDVCSKQSILFYHSHHYLYHHCHKQWYIIMYNNNDKNNK